MAQFEKGHKPTGRRAPGTPNEISRATREALAMLTEGELEKMIAFVKTLEGEKHFEYMIQLFPYLISKHSVKDVNVNQNNLDTTELKHLSVEQIKRMQAILLEDVQDAIIVEPIALPETIKIK